MQHTDNKRKKILILGASEIQLPIILRAKELGYYTIVSDYNPNAPALEFADKKLIISTNDIPALLNAAIDNNIDGVLTTSDFPVRSVAHICEALRLSGPSINSAILCTDKYQLRKHLSNHQFLVPKFKIIKSKDSISEIDYFPCVIKPIDSSGSRGVQKVNTVNELMNAYDNTLQHSKSATIIIEEFIEGTEYSVETLTQNGITRIVAITEKTVTGAMGAFFVEDRHVIPANIKDKDVTAISETVIKVLNSIELDNSPTHTELKINSKGIYIIEIGARLGGDFITSDLVPLATGVDMLENTINIALNRNVNVTKIINKYSGIQFINTDNYYLIETFIKSKKPFIVKYQIEPYKNIQLKSSFDRLGYFIVQADNREQLNHILNCKK